MKAPSDGAALVNGGIRHPRSSRRPGITLVLLVAVLAACTGQRQTPVGLSDIPRPPGATVYDGTAENVVDRLLLAGSAAYADGTLKVDTQLYGFPTPEAGAQSLTFFTSTLPQQGWAERTDAALTGSIGQVWQRGDQRLTFVLIELDTSTVAVLLLSTPR